MVTSKNAMSYAYCLQQVSPFFLLSTIAHLKQLYENSPTEMFILENCLFWGILLTR